VGCTPSGITRGWCTDVLQGATLRESSGGACGHVGRVNRPAYSLDANADRSDFNDMTFRVRPMADDSAPPTVKAMVRENILQPRQEHHAPLSETKDPSRKKSVSNTSRVNKFVSLRIQALAKDSAAPSASPLAQDAADRGDVNNGARGERGDVNTCQRHFVPPPWHRC